MIYITASISSKSAIYFSEMVAVESFYKVDLETELRRFTKLRVEDIEEIQAWLTTQPHLPTLSGNIKILKAYTLF